MKTLHTQFQLKWMSSVPMKTRFRNSANSVRGARTGGATRRTRAIPPSPASTLTPTSGEPQPLWPLVCTPSTTSTSPTVSITKPRRSKRRGADSSRLSSTTYRVMKIAAMPRGTFTKKNQRQLSFSVSTPPTSGPSDWPIVPAAAQMPIAWPRSAGGKALLTIASEATKLSAVPRPWGARAAISQPVDCAVPAAIEPAMNVISPSKTTRRRPNVSARRPAAICGAAKVKRNALKTHASVVVVVSSACPMAGRATVRPNASIVSMRSGTAIAATTSQRPLRTRSAGTLDAVMPIGSPRDGSSPEIARERWKRLRRELVGRQPLPVPLGNGRPQAIRFGLSLGQQPRLVEAHDMTVLDARLAVDDHLIDVIRRPALYERLDRVPIGAHPEAPHVDQHDVGLRSRREPAQVVAAQRASPAEGGRREDVGSGAEREVVLDDLAEVGRPAHLADEVARVGVGAEADVDPGQPELCERLQRVAAPGEHERAVGDRGAALSEDLEIPPGRHRGEVMGGVHDAVTDDGAGREQSGVGQVLDGRHRVAAQDLVELEQVLAGVDLDANAQLVGRLAGGAQERRAAGVDLIRKEHPLDAAFVRAGVLADERLRAIQPGQAPGLVVLVIELARLAHAVIGRAVGRAHERPQAQLARDSRVGLGGGDDVDHGRAAVPQHLGQREASADVGVLAWPERLHALLRGVVVEEAGVEEIATADVGDQSPARFHVGVTVNVDEAGDDELADRIDAPIDGSGEGSSDERHAVVLEDEGAAAQQPMPTLGVRDDVAALDQGLHACLLILALGGEPRADEPLDQRHRPEEEDGHDGEQDHGAERQLGLPVRGRRQDHVAEALVRAHELAHDGADH